jgi:hypothetical protein
MNTILSKIVPALVGVLFLTALPASAQIVFTLNNVSLEVGGVSAGTLSGTFTTNSSVLTSTTQLLTWDITATSTSGTTLAHNFAGFTYTTSNSTAYYNVGGSGLLTGFELDSPQGTTTSNNSDSVRLYFSSDLSATGTVNLGTSSPTISYESEHVSGGNRDVAAGTVFAVPEPSSWMLGCCAMALFAGLLGAAPHRAALS